MSITIGKVLDKFRKQSGLSQIEVAKRMGLSAKSGRKYISRLENEQIKQPFLNTVLVYLDAVGVSYRIDPSANRTRSFCSGRVTRRRNIYAIDDHGYLQKIKYEKPKTKNQKQQFTQ